MPRKPPLHSVGTDPDVRFSYANERTFLAWNRTSLALLAAGLAVTSLLPSFDVPGGRRIIGIPLIVLGAILAGASYLRWESNERAMRVSVSSASSGAATTGPCARRRLPCVGWRSGFGPGSA